MATDASFWGRSLVCSKLEVILSVYPVKVGEAAVNLNRVRLAGVLGFFLVGAVLLFSNALSLLAHGSMQSPVSRIYACYLEGPESPDSAACRDAVAAGGTQPLYDWTEVNLPDVAGQHQARIPDGKLCSAGRAKYAAFDQPRTDWSRSALAPAESYSFRYAATAPHNHGHFEIYVTRDGYDPTQALQWADLEQVAVIQEPPLVDGYYLLDPISLPPDRKGHHLIYSIWQRHDSPEAFYTCSDVWLGADSTPTPTATAPTDLLCVVDYQVVNAWNSGFQTEVTITNQGSQAVNGWTLEWNFAGGQQIANLWNGAHFQSGAAVTVTSADWNRALPGNGGKVSFGFVANGSSLPKPEDFRLNDASCTPAGGSSVTATPTASATATPTPSPTGTPPTATPTPTPTPSSTPPGIGYAVQGNRIVDSAGQSVQLRGVNWFGFETQNYTFHGLWSRNWQGMIDQMAGLGFNAVRVPFCPQTLRDVAVSSIDYHRNPDLQGLTSLALLDRLLAAFNARGIYILLDHHRPDCNAISELWYTNQYSEEAWISDLAFVAQRYAGLAYFLGIDLKNEPHGAATWGVGNPATDWDKAASRAAAAILAINPHILIFVEGIQENSACSGSVNHWWGGNLEPLACAPLEIPREKLVLSPHVYGPDVYQQPYFSDTAFPANLPAIWEAHFGRFAADYPVVIGEFGGRYGHGGDPKDRVWQDALVDYLIQKEMRSAFYWSWNPNSGDTGGILQEDWSQPWADKVALLQRLWGEATPPTAPARSLYLPLMEK